MSFSLDYFQFSKAQLLNEFQKLKTITEKKNNFSLAKRIQQIINQTELDTFQIVVVGEFSRGKSTFINSLLGKVVLPSSSLPTTTILNKIVYSKEPYSKLHFHDHKQKWKITEEEFKKIVAPPEPIVGDAESEKEFEKQVAFIKTVAYAEIGQPLPFCKGGVEIIDTPGTNDLDPAREAITNEIIPQSDTAILILSATKILSESEMSFLKDRILASDIRKVFVVVNFKDHLTSPEDEQKVMKYAKDKLTSVLGMPKIYLVAAKKALDTRRVANGEELTVRRRPVNVWPMEQTGLLEFEHGLSEFLQYERGAVKLRKPIKTAGKVASEILQMLQVEKITFYENIEEIKARVTAFQPKVREMQEKQRDFMKTIEMTLGGKEKTLINWYEKELSHLAKEVLETYEENYNTLSFEKLTRKIEATIAPLERRLHEQKRQKVDETIRKSLEHLSGQMKDDWARLDRGFHAVIKVDEMSLAEEPYFERSGFEAFINEIASDLEESMIKSKSFFGSLMAGVGLALTGIVVGFGRLFGAFDDRKGKLKRQLQQRFTLSKKEKLRSFKGEWKGTTKALLQQYKEKINGELAQMNEQLEIIKNSARMEEDEIRAKLQELTDLEAEVKAIDTKMKQIERQLQGRREGGVITS